jgi:hypothetical protein
MPSLSFRETNSLQRMIALGDAVSSSFFEDMPALALAESSWRGRWSANALPSPGSAVGIARTEVELEAIGRLRYEFYAAHEGKAYARADHVRRRLIEPVDDVSLNFQAADKGRVLAAVRLTWAEDALTDPHQRRLIQAALPDCLSTTLVLSWFAVMPDLCASPMIVQMLREVSWTSLASGARSCLVGTRREFTSIFERFGFCGTGLQTAAPFADQMHILGIDLNPETLAYVYRSETNAVSSSRKMRSPAWSNIDDLARYAFSIPQA